MTLELFGAILGIAVFIMILAFRLPNWLTYVAVAPIVVFLGTMTKKEVYAVFSSSGLQLMFIICIFMGLMSATGLDSVIGNTAVKYANKVAGGDPKKEERMLLLVLFVFGNAFSFFLANNHVAMALVPVIYGIAKRTKFSYSKMCLFVIFSTTLGGACTLVGTTSNVYANTALVDAGLKGFGMLDFAWVGVKYDHVLPFDGYTDWNAFMKLLKEIKYGGDFTYEIHRYTSQLPDAMVPAALRYSVEMGNYLLSLAE